VASGRILLLGKEEGKIVRTDGPKAGIASHVAITREIVPFTCSKVNLHLVRAA
jgi:hypothetical protein